MEPDMDEKSCSGADLLDHVTRQSILLWLEGLKLANSLGPVPRAVYYVILNLLHFIFDLGMHSVVVVEVVLATSSFALSDARKTGPEIL